MPIYEFYCPQCHAIYNFWSKTINTEKRPPCPGCQQDRLQRCISSFAVTSGASSEPQEAADDLPIDEARMEHAMNALAAEAEGVDEEDPKAAARLMRRFSDLTGLDLGERMDEVMSRLESGEDPEALEAEMGELLDEDENPLAPAARKGRSKTTRPPRRDDTLYEM